MFENVEILVEELPRADALEWQPLDPAYRKRLLVDRLINELTRTARLPGR